MTDTSTVPEPSKANRITQFDRPKRPGRPVEGTVYVKPPTGPQPPTETERAEGWRDQVRLLLAAIHHGYGYSPGCGNDSCPCARPQLICESWERDPDTPPGWCVRCGWERDAHPETAPGS